MGLRNVSIARFSAHPRTAGRVTVPRRLLVNAEHPIEASNPQGALFDDAELRPLPAGIGYRGPIACSAAGITYRQLDYWARTGLVEPSVRSASGSGSQRLYGFRDILILRIVKRLIDTGVSLPNIRAAVDHLGLGAVLRGCEDVDTVA